MDQETVVTTTTPEQPQAEAEHPFVAFKAKREGREKKESASSVTAAKSEPADTNQEPEETKAEKDPQKTKAETGLTKALVAERAKSRELSERLEALEASLNAQPRKQPTKQADAEVESKPETPKTEKAVAPDAPDLDDYATVKEWKTDFAKWSISQTEARVKAAIAELQAQQKEQSKQAAKDAQVQKVNESWKAQAAKAQEKYGDEWMEATKSVGGRDGVNDEVQNLIMESPFGADIVHYLHSNPEVLAQVRGMRRHYEIGILFGKIEAQISKAPEAKQQKASNAPAPIQAVGGRVAASDNSKEDPYPLWVEKRNADIKRVRSRS